MSWKFFRGPEAFLEHRDQWDALNAAAHNHILLDSYFWSPLVKLWGHQDLYLGISQDARCPGMILVEPVGFGQWRTFQPSQAPLGPLLLGCASEIEAQLSALIGSLPGFALTLGITQQDPDYTHVRSDFDDERFEFMDYIVTPRIPLQGTFDDYWKSRGKDLSGNLARRKRRLEEQRIEMTLKEIRAAQEMQEAVSVYGQFEESGWKGSSGTAVGFDNAQGAFYCEMLASLCERREAVVYQLLMNGQPIASNLCVERGGMMIMLKTAYDETQKKLSPSFIMLEGMLKLLFADKRATVLEFYGRSKEWHQKWTEDERTMYHVNVFRHAAVSQARKFIKARQVVAT